MQYWGITLKRGWQCCFSKPFLLSPLPTSNVESTENDLALPDMNISSGGGGEGKYVIFTGLLPPRPKSFGQGCLKTSLLEN